MAWTQIIWDYGPDGNVEHIAEHGFTPADVDHVLATFDHMEISRSTGNLLVFGYVGNQRVVVPVDEISDDIVYPISCYASENERN